MALTPFQPLKSSTSTTSQNTQTAVMLIDDHDLFRAGLRTLLEGEQIRVVGDCRCANAPMEMIRRTKANVAMLDITTATGESTLKLATEISSLTPRVDVILFTHADAPLDLYSGIRAGVKAYITKDKPVSVIKEAIDAVRSGNAWLEPSMISTVMSFIHTGQVPTTSMSKLSDRETEVLKLVAHGYENTEIAQALSISTKTAKNHVSNILAKLELSNRVQAAVAAVRSGII